MRKFKISGFADEISCEPDVQIEALNKLGIEYIEPRFVGGKNISDYTAEEIKEFKRKLDRGGIRVSSIGSPIGKIGIGEDMDAHIKKLKNTLEVAKVLETKFVRVFSFYIPSGEDAGKYRDEVLRRMERMTAEAKKAGIILLHENEKGIYGDNAERCTDIAESIDSEYLGAVFDPANFVQCGQATYPEAFEMLKPFVKYMHIKDATADGTVVPAGYGCGRVADIISALYAGGFDGFLSLEPHLTEFDGFAELEKDGIKLEKSADGGEKAFTAAYKALSAILNKTDR